MGNSVPSGEAGYRVLRIHPGSPAEAADLELFFDFVVQIENEVLCSPEVSVQSVLKRIDAADGRPIHLTVYNARHRMNRGKGLGGVHPARASSSKCCVLGKSQIPNHDVSTQVCIQPARAAASAVLLGKSQIPNNDVSTRRSGAPVVVHDTRSQIPNPKSQIPNDDVST
ncbi:hypothetical protein, conserved, partial [Eimeria necatrix]